MSDSLGGRLRHTAGEHLDYRRITSLRLLLSFVITFGIVRIITYTIHVDRGPFHDIVTGGGLHIHHYVWGIALVLVSGFLALNVDQARWHPLLAIPFGIGAALIVDEFALLLNLRDVYWARQGRWSVDLAIIVSALLALYYAAQSFWRQALADVLWGARRAVRRRR
jgi:hypothetical protein